MIVESSLVARRSSLVALRHKLPFRHFLPGETDRKGLPHRTTHRGDEPAETHDAADDTAKTRAQLPSCWSSAVIVRFRRFLFLGRSAFDENPLRNHDVNPNRAVDQLRDVDVRR